MSGASERLPMNDSLRGAGAVCVDRTSHTCEFADEGPDVETRRFELGVPARLRDDLLYLWASFRLRYRPLKMILFLVLLSLLCWAWQSAGARWFEPWLGQRIVLMRGSFTQIVLLRTSQAFFSSLNFLSCVTIVIMGRSLRHLLREGHLESLLLVPGRVRPSAMFYAISTRYLPLAPIALLVIYLDPLRTPFAYEPFYYYSPLSVPPDYVPIFWAAAHQISVLLFCVVNLFMDLALAYWWMNRWKASWPTILSAVLLIGLVSPIVLVSIYEAIDAFVYARVSAPGLLNEWASGTGGYIARSSPRDMAAALRYSSVSFFSLLLAFAALANLDRRWARLLASPHHDPVMLRPIE